MEFRPLYGIAWDDKPETFERLVDEFQPQRIAMDVTSVPDGFRELAQGEARVDFAVLDLYREDPRVLGEPEVTGLKLAEEYRQDVINRKVPVFIVTSAFSTAQHEDMELGPEVFLLSKSLRTTWLARDIIRHLEDLGVRTWEDSVMLFGDDEEAVAMAESALVELQVQCHRFPDIFTGDPSRMRELRHPSRFLLVRGTDTSPDLSPREEFACGIIAGLPRGRERILMVSQEHCSGQGLRLGEASRFEHQGKLESPQLWERIANVIRE